MLFLFKLFLLVSFFVNLFQSFRYCCFIMLSVISIVGLFAGANVAVVSSFLLSTSSPYLLLLILFFPSLTHSPTFTIIVSFPLALFSSPPSLPIAPSSSSSSSTNRRKRSHGAMHGDKSIPLQCIHDQTFKSLITGF